MPSIMVDETGISGMMQGLESANRGVQDKHRTNSKTACSAGISRSGDIMVSQVSSTEGLPRTPLLEQGPAVAPYNPPALNNPSERVMQSDQSFQLNRGIGNNPTNRDEYVREQLNK
jgi:hypothetical protein